MIKKAKKNITFTYPLSPKKKIILRNSSEKSTRTKFIIIVEKKFLWFWYISWSSEKCGMSWSVEKNENFRQMKERILSDITEAGFLK